METDKPLVTYQNGSYPTNPTDIPLILNLLALYNELTKINFDEIVVDRINQYICLHGETTENIFSILLQNQNSPAHASLLAFFSNFGIGTPLDQEKAFKWYKYAAECGDVFALLQLGECYENELGTKHDQAKCIECYRMAAEKGHPQGLYKYAWYLRDQENRVKSFIYYEISADKGFLPSTMKKIDYYLGGIGVERDFHSAIRLAVKCKKNGLHNYGPWPIYAICGLELLAPQKLMKQVTDSLPARDPNICVPDSNGRFFRDIQLVGDLQTNQFCHNLTHRGMTLQAGNYIVKPHSH
ncbi:hypothetical protein G9A89_017286 [Geosiphon pyriformis]|nr:hypothetical protein G9A89_017286 [Geosiphon pyriformis]